MHDGTWIRWYMTLFFMAYAIWLYLRRECFADESSVFCLLPLAEEDRARVMTHYCRREANGAVFGTRMGGGLAALSLMLALLTALTHASYLVLYAGLCVAMAALLTFAYAGVRRESLRRFASLRVRRLTSVVPTHTWTLAGVAAALPLFWVLRSPVVCVCVTTAALAIVVLAWRVASMPALIVDTNIAVEMFVDARLRTVRSTGLLCVAAAPAFVFASFSGPPQSVAQAVATLAIATATAALMWLQWRQVRRVPSAAEVTGLGYASP